MYESILLTSPNLLPRGGNEVSVSPVGCPVKQETNRVSQPKRAMRPLQGRRAKIEVAVNDPITKAQWAILRSRKRPE